MSTARRGRSTWFNADESVDPSFYFQVFSVDDIAATFDVGEPDDRLQAVADLADRMRFPVEPPRVAWRVVTALSGRDAAAC